MSTVKYLHVLVMNCLIAKQIFISNELFNSQTDIY
jgi:hypothetical protein